MSLLDKFKKASKLDYTEALDKTKFHGEKEQIPTPVPMINVALSGNINGGLTPGLTVLAGPSKHFKTNFSLLMAAAYMRKHKESVMLFYDSEFGSPAGYFKSFGIDPSRVLHIPIKNIEELKFDLTAQLEAVTPGDKVIIVADSVGNLASKKEVEDAKDEKSVADMTRAKQLKSVFRIATPYLSLLNIPMIAINHTYKEQCLHGDTLIQTGRGSIPIRDVIPGDIVKALTGDHKVTHSYGPEDLDSTGKRFLEIEFDDGSFVKCTHDHKFYVDGGKWVEADDLVPGQKMY